MRVELWLVQGEQRRLIKKVRTDADGRIESPLLKDAEVKSGQYELVFFVGDYFKDSAPEKFLDRVPVRFRLKSGESYHIPLLCSPWSYATYRGS
jgi:5-hydroxyisourate hydrolase